MFAIRLRVSPCRARCSPRSVGRSTVSEPLSCSMRIAGLTAWLSSPLGPFTVTRLSVTDTVTESRVTVNGPKGELSQAVSPAMRIEQDNGSLTVERPTDRGEHRALHGLTRSLIANMVEGCLLYTSDAADDLLFVYL